MSIFKSVTVGLLISGLIATGTGASAAPVPLIVMLPIAGLHEPLVVTRPTNAGEDQALWDEADWTKGFATELECCDGAV